MARMGGRLTFEPPRANAGFTVNLEFQRARA